jgi:hypothetical protein
MDKKKVILIEFNEFNLDLLKKCADFFDLPSIKKVLSFESCPLKTLDSYESNFLEPWVQWVSIHTGLDSNKHQIKHLGDVPHLEAMQVWEALNEQSITTGIWGAMNASKGKDSHQLFFFPDPWTFSEKAFPNSLNYLLDPLRYVSKNYLEHSFYKIIKSLFNVFQLFMKNKLGYTLLSELFKMGVYSLKFKGEHFPFICSLEKLSVDLFLQYQKNYDPRFSILFINSLAHLQHHHWKDFDYENNKKLAFGMKKIDGMFEKIFQENKDTLFLITNGLSQKNTSEETPWILYRQYEHASLMKLLGIPVKKIEPHMTHDAHLFFDNTDALEISYEKLSSIQIQNQKLFEVEKYPQECKLFYKIIFTDELAPDAQFEVYDQTYPFFEYFKKIVKRTGKHIPDSILFSSEKITHPIFYNHEIFNYILNLYGVTKR